MINNTIKLDTLLDFSNIPVDNWTKQWMKEQHESMCRVPENSINYWDKEDDYNSELDYSKDKYNGKEKPDLSHLEISNQGKISVESLPDV